MQGVWVLRGSYGLYVEYIPEGSSELKKSHVSFAISPINRSSLLTLSLLFFISHNQIIITFQPSPLNFPMFFRSRTIVSDIFFFQKSLFVSGSLEALQFSWPCQKQPCTNIIVWYFGRMMSGFPGYLLSFIRYLKPFENKNLRTRISGFVSLPRILDITSLRFSLE